MEYKAMDQRDMNDCLRVDEEPSNPPASAGQTESVEFQRRRMESVGEDTEYGDETQSLLANDETRSGYLQIPFGFQSRGSYKHASKNCEIVGVTHNSRFRQFVFLDSRGITSWSYESVYNTVTRHLNYPSYQFNVLRLIIFSRKFNVYFVLSKEYALKVFNLNFHEVFSVSAEMHSVLCMVFNHGKDELITGGTGGMKFWTFGEIDKDKQKAWERDSRPMANYGLVLRASYPDMGGSWVKQVELDEAMQRLYCLSERNVVAYDMEGNLLFQILDAHRGPVTGCVYSKACNFLVTVGTDCDVNVWSRSKSGGKVHTFTGHSKAITKIMLHPENSALVITAAMDGIVKVNSLDFMEEIYSLPVFSEGIYWMNIVSSKLIYCCSNRVIEVFSLNHLCDFWALSRCSVMSLSLVTYRGKSTRVMAVGNDSSVRLISRKRHNLSTVLPPPPISPLNMVKDVTYSREFNMMYLLINEQEIWVYYTRTNPATRVESWKLDFIEDIHRQHSQEAVQKSRASSPWLSDGNRSPSPVAGDSPSLGPRSILTRETDGRESSLSTRKEKVVITCVGMLYSPIIMQSVEGEACPDATHFLMAGTQDGRVLFLHMFWQGLKYHQLQANKDAVLEVYHDQVMNTLVTKCRHPGIVILIWSLPFLQLLKRVDCDADMTCFTRMNNILLCGHKSGYLHHHSLAFNNHELSDDEGEKAAGSKRAPPRDHQSSINSVDSNSNLEIFCSASRDGVIKIWDKDKTLLREIMMDETLTVASFLNSQGDMLIGFKQHIFIIPHEKVCPAKDGLSSDFGTGSLDDEAFETDSDIYEDPSVRFESKKILQPDPTNMDNYLVPFPNLQLKTSWFMEGRPPPDLEQQNQQEEEESISFMSDRLSLAPTEVYWSPSTTPRRLSLVSSVAMSERRASTELWDLPEFGDSPVSSPPRTPPPEPTPPSTPPPDEESEEKASEGEENAKGEQQQSDDPTCGQCADALKKDGKKKVPIVPSFRREGGRLGNVSIDSRSLRSGHGGPGYAAPVARKMVVQNPEPKVLKPRRIPRPVMKKTKKQKETGEEETTNETDNKEHDKTENENLETKAERNDEDAVKERDVEDSSYRTPNVVNMPPGEEKPLLQQSTTGSQRGPGTSALPQEMESSRPTKDEAKAPFKETAKDIRGPQDKNPSLTSQKHSDGNVAKAQPGGNVPPGEVNYENETKAQNKTAFGNEESGEAQQTQQIGKPAEHYSPKPNETHLVTYLDPDTGKMQQRPADEIPDDAEILDDYDEDEALEGGVDDFLTAPAEGGSSSSFRSKRTERGQKSVSFLPHGPESVRRSQRQLPNVYTSGRDSPTLRSHNGLVFKETVVPVYGSNRPGDLFTKTSKNTMGVSPLTIFALARSRRENAEKATKKRGRSADGRLWQKLGATENSSLRTEEQNMDDFELNDDDIARLMGNADLQAPSEGQESVISTRPPSVRKSESSLMRWCIGALKKADREVLFPPRPTTRPSSSPSAVKSNSAKKEGNTLYLNTKETQTRPKTADTVRSNSTNIEEYSVFPYETTTSANQTPRQQTRGHKSAPPIRVNTWKHVSSDEDGDFMDAYRAMRSSIGLHESDEDYMKDIMSRESAGNERPSDPRNIPVLDASDYGGNWQIKVLERANRLKQQRLERQKTATERRQTLENKQRERWKNSNHFECAQEPVTKSESVIEFITPAPTSTVRNATPLPLQDQLQSRTFKEQEFTSEQPYRLRLNPQSGGLGLNPTARNLMNLKSCDRHLSDVANVLPKPPPSASIPSKCSRYVLVAQPDVKQTHVQATAMEETLLMLRFPKSRVRGRHTSANIPRPYSNRNVRFETGFEM